MKTSESIVKLAPDLVKLQADATNPKATAENPHFKSKFTPLDDLVDLARQLCAKHNFAFLQEASSQNGGADITTRLLHTSGEWVEFDPLHLLPDKATPQGMGSAITYGRRYTLGGLLGVATETDDDGNAAEKEAAAPPQSDEPQRATGPRTPGGATEKSVNFAKRLFVDRGICQKGKRGESDETKEQRRDNNKLAVLTWLRGHEFVVDDDSEDALLTLTSREVSDVIETLKTEIAAMEKAYPDGDVMV
jgi:hypothetical protein